MSFESLGLRAELLRALSKKGYTQPTPVQAESIPLILSGRDVLAGAQTGTGKTAGFALPLLQRLSASSPDPSHNLHPSRLPFQSRKPKSRGKGGRSEKAATPESRRPVRALILTPTRELASQVEESVRTYGTHLPHRSFSIFGGVPFGSQLRQIRHGVDIVVATPGRLLDHITQGTIDLSRVEILVLDEADRMLDMGFIRDIRKILGVLPKQRQTLFFSATFSKEIRRLADDFLTDPAPVQVTPLNAAAELVDQAIHPVDRGRKRALLSHLIRSGSWNQVLVFTRTKHGANRLATQLGTDGITSTAIHGNKSQANRTKALRDFKRGGVRVLVATDIAARGLDIDQLPHVVNYDLSYVPEDYVHRIGRTGRAGNEGTAISLVSAEEKDLLKGIERLLKRDLPVKVVAGFEPGFRTSSDSRRSNSARPESRRPRSDRPGSARPARGSGKPRRSSRTNDAHRQAGPKPPAGTVRYSGFSEGDRPAGTPGDGAPKAGRRTSGRKPKSRRSSFGPRRPRAR